LILYERNDPMPDTKTSKWRDVRKRAVKAADEPYIKQGREAIRAELRLSSVRKQRKASQAAVAERLAVSQSNVSQLERVGDPRLSTVADYIGALGGHLEIAAVFDDERVTIAGPPTVGAAHKPRSVRGRAKSTGRVKSTKAKAPIKAASRTKRAPAKASRP
jgi:transcriptional regulator with XRE-family HTH domain